MIFPLVLAALGIGVLVAYAGTREQCSDHEKAVKDARAAQEAAEAQLEAARRAPPPRAPAPALPQAPPHTAPAAKTVISKETSARFWTKTKYKPGHKLDPKDAGDARMIPVWLAIQAQVKREYDAGTLHITFDQQVAESHEAAKVATVAAAQKVAQVAQTAQTQTERARATWMAQLTLASMDEAKAQFALTAATMTHASDASIAPLQMAQGEALARIAEAKAELSKLDAAKAAQLAQTAQTQAQRAVAAWTSTLTLAIKERDDAQIALHKARAAGIPAAVFESALDQIRARIADARSELTKLGVAA
jgi:hypothetical protein